MVTRYINKTFCLILAIIVAALPTPEASGQEGKSPEELKVEAETAEARSIEELGFWKFNSGKSADQELKLNKSPVLRWTNPTVGRVYGTVYLVTNDNRPTMIISPYKWFKPYRSLEVECLSVASSEVEARRNGKVVWAATKPGVEWKAVPGEPAVGKTPLERQRQMKQLAQDFTAELVDQRSNESGEKLQLRQLTQPIFKYESAAQHIVEGGVFAYVVGTDPEVFLLLEAYESDGKSQWRYGAARMNSDQLTVKYRNEDVWHVNHLPYETYRDSRQPYFGFLVSEQ